MTAITVEIDLDQPLPERYLGQDEDGPQYGPMSMRDSIIEAAARLLADRIEDNEIKAIGAGVKAKVNALVDARLAPLVEEAFAAEIVVTSEWGVERQRTTLRQLIVDRAREQVTEPNQSYSRSNERVLGKVMREEIDRALTTELSAAVKAAKADLTKKLEATAAEVIAQTITSGLR